jgi:hypothetical protein
MSFGGTGPDFSREATSIIAVTAKQPLVLKRTLNTPAGASNPGGNFDSSGYLQYQLNENHGSAVA